MRIASFCEYESIIVSKSLSLCIQSILLFLFFVQVIPVWPKQPISRAIDLTQLDLEQLMNIEVISVSKKPEKQSETAAAIFVITEEDIRRSGATSIPELLRMVPGIHVARIDSNKWAVSARGFNDRFANKLLVLIDGRTIYVQSFAGVYWEMQDLMLEDIERIEVIRGPGASLWGANAVNGVINIITKNAKDTQGGLLTSGGGTEEQGFGSFRYGSTIGDDLYYRFYTKYLNRDDFHSDNPYPANDNWDSFRSGFRMDFEPSELDQWTLIGDIQAGQLGSTYLTPVPDDPFLRVFEAEDDAQSAFLLSDWNRSLSDISDITLLTYYDYNFRQHELLEETRHTFELNFQHDLQLSTIQELSWGLGYRYTYDNVSESLIVQHNDHTRNDQLFSLFFHDEITIIEDRMKLALGSRLEHNSFTGFEIQPNARLLLTPHEHHTIWAAFSRAVRTPSHGEHGGTIPADVLPANSAQNPLPFPTLLKAISLSNFDSEELLAYDLGYRVLLNDRLNLDIATFYNDYDSVRGGEVFGELMFDPEPPAHFILPLFNANKLDAITYGIEVATTYRILDWWEWKTAYTLFDMSVEGDSPSQEMFEDDNPNHQVSFRSFMDLPQNLELDLWLRYVDNLPNQNISSYTTMDVRAGWKPSQNFEVSFVAQNLFDPRHAEFNAPVFVRTNATEVERGFYAKLTWRF